jgi:hypothetical protein
MLLDCLEHYILGGSFLREYCEMTINFYQTEDINSGEINYVATTGTWYPPDPAGHYCLGNNVLFQCLRNRI